MNKNMHTQTFLQELKGLCKEMDVKLILEDKPKIKYAKNMYVSGYFQQNPAEIVVATKKNEEAWLSILVHESCHMDQWIENSGLWKLHNSQEDISQILDDHVSGKNKSTTKKFKASLNKSLRLELDCEKRSIEKIKKYNLPIDIKTYIKKANAYIFLYSVMATTNKWCDKAPYKIKEIFDIMPDKFLRVKDYIHTPKMLNIYKEHCYNK